MGEVVLDPFTGQSLSAEQLEDRLALYRRGSGLPSELELPLEFFLRAASPRQILARMLRNLKEVRRAAQDWTGLLAVQQRLVVLMPDDPVEKRDRGLALVALGANTAAAADLAAYLAARDDAPDAGALRARLATLVERGAPPLQ